MISSVFGSVSNANPQQPRGERGKWDKADRAAIYHAVRKMFGGKDPGPIQAMPEKSGQGEPQSDPAQDAEAAEQHSPAAAMAANVVNAMNRWKRTEAES